MNPHTQTIQEAAAILEDAKQQIKEKLESEKDLKPLSETIFNQLSTVQKRFYALSGLPEMDLQNNAIAFKPLSRIMGIAVDARKPVSEADLQPTLTEKEKLIKRIYEFYEMIPTMSNEKVLEVLREPKGEAILRGAAKIAQVQNWKEGDLTIFFVEDIKTGINTINELNYATDSAHGSASSAEGNTESANPWVKPLPELNNPIVNEPASFPELDNKPQLNQIGDIVKSEYQKSEEQKEGVGTKPAGLEQKDSEFSGTDEVNQSDDTTLNLEEVIAEAKRLKAEGLTIKEIAEKLGKSTGSISNYLNKK